LLDEYFTAISEWIIARRCLMNNSIFDIVILRVILRYLVFALWLRANLYVQIYESRGKRSVRESRLSVFSKFQQIFRPLCFFIIYHTFASFDNRNCNVARRDIAQPCFLPLSLLIAENIIRKSVCDIPLLALAKLASRSDSPSF